MSRVSRLRKKASKAVGKVAKAAATINPVLSAANLLNPGVGQAINAGVRTNPVLAPASLFGDVGQGIKDLGNPGKWREGVVDNLVPDEFVGGTDSPFIGDKERAKREAEKQQQTQQTNQTISDLSKDPRYADQIGAATDPLLNLYTRLGTGWMEEMKTGIGMETDFTKLQNMRKFNDSFNSAYGNFNPADLPKTNANENAAIGQYSDFGKSGMSHLDAGKAYLDQLMGQNNPGMNTLAATARGDYLNNNPYIDATYNKAADAVTRNLVPNINASFSGAGRTGSRGQGDFLATRVGDQLNNLATDIYGGNYQAERARMNEAANAWQNNSMNMFNALPQLQQQYDQGALTRAGATGDAGTMQYKNAIRDYSAPLNILQAFSAFNRGEQFNPSQILYGQPKESWYEKLAPYMDIASRGAAAVGALS